MKVIYRCSDAGYTKKKPLYISNDYCLNNFTSIFKDIKVIADNCSKNTLEGINTYVNSNDVIKVSIGSGAGTFNLALDIALEYDEDEIVYFVENDYLHKHESPKILEEAFTLGASFVTLYDHPDKYIDPSKGGNPYCGGGAEDTRVYITKSCHWKLTNSTTMTFAAKVSTLKRVESILRKHTSESYPRDFDMFIELRNKGELLVSSIPGYSTHGETAWLSPLTDWSKVLPKIRN
tara:strand:- start:100 stop:801 length:702 start_codon:yes stop_codon:yes gene_type:complete